MAGQYQVNVRLPGSGAVGPLTTPAQLPVLITVGGRTSQPGVTIWVAPRLKVTAPAAAALHGATGVAWAATANQATASEGTAPYQLAITAGSLPPRPGVQCRDGSDHGNSGHRFRRHFLHGDRDRHRFGCGPSHRERHVYPHSCGALGPAHFPAKTRYTLNVTLKLIRNTSHPSR